MKVIIASISLLALAAISSAHENIGRVWVCHCVHRNLGHPKTNNFLANNTKTAEACMMNGINGHLRQTYGFKYDNEGHNMAYGDEGHNITLQLHPTMGSNEKKIAVCIDDPDKEPELDVRFGNHEACHHHGRSVGGKYDFHTCYRVWTVLP